MANKEDLLGEARELGATNADEMTKPELEDAIESRAPAELGPAIPEGESAPAPPEAGRSACDVRSAGRAQRHSRGGPAGPRGIPRAPRRRRAPGGTLVPA